MRRWRWFFPFLLLLPACVGGSLSNHSEIEEYPLRAATESEGKRLKHCLRSAYQAQMSYRKKTGKAARKFSELPIDDACNGFRVSQKKTNDGFEIIAQFNEGDFTVRWSINQDQIIEEHLDPSLSDDEDLFE